MGDEERTTPPPEPPPPPPPPPADPSLERITEGKGLSKEELAKIIREIRDE